MDVNENVNSWVNLIFVGAFHPKSFGMSNNPACLLTTDWSSGRSSHYTPTRR